MNWATQVASNIFPPSIEKADFSKALREWEYRGDMYDTGYAAETCKLCNHPDIRYQFTIVNKFNSNELLVGSECIKRFDGIAVLDADGNTLAVTAAKKKIDSDRRRLISDARTRGLLNSLVDLSRKEQEFEIVSFEDYYKKHGCFTPKQLAILVWRFEKNKVSFNKRYFNLNIRRQKDQKALLSLRAFQIRKIWDCLSISQKDFLFKNGWTG